MRVVKSPNKYLWDLRALWMRRYDIVLCADCAGWILDQVAFGLAANLPPECRPGISGGPDLHFLRRKVIHFLAQFDVFGGGRSRGLHRSNRLVATWWHGMADSKDPSLREAFASVADAADSLDRITVTCSIYEKVLRSAGVRDDRLLVLPLGTDLRRFKRPTKEQRIQARQRFGIPRDAFCVGSFQKDGVGWGEGLEPKLIKGPDVLVAAFAKVPRRDLFVLLSGPARGYVMRGLEKAGVLFTCAGLMRPWEMPALYHALDAYLISSREEGGPAALLEAMGCGVPVVSTRVGMPADILADGRNGFLVDVEDAQRLASSLTQLSGDVGLQRRLSEAAGEAVKSYDWRTVARKYYDGLYAPLLRSLQNDGMATGH